MKSTENQNERLGHDPIPGAADDHPASTGIGAAGGAATGALLGASAGPLGIATGALVGAVIGAIAGKGIAQSLDPTSEELYWQKHFHEQSYHLTGFTYDDFLPAYRLGWQHYTPGVSFDDVEKDLDDRWERVKGTSKLPAALARDAARASWARMERMSPPPD